MRTVRVAGLAALLAIAGCSGADQEQSAPGASQEATTKAVATETSEPEATTEEADQGDVMLCRTHDDIASDSRLHVRAEMPVTMLQHYVQDWMDDLGAADRTATNTKLIAETSAVAYELSLLNAQLQIALNDTSTDSYDPTEQMVAVRTASQKMASTCRLDIGGDYSEVIFSTVAG